ncbi:MAG: MFS transporter [Gammaproteobacteria bacterium]|jgi:MFS family permease|nr:MFS transporter [Gammaproteobacteria bacterium]MBU1603491.1 MFS transporter [Gammaproteobacteria bacterium]MBU2433011.1 MFS transporter [Gammaproteobacteria bacterium]MBU2450254.1 MFS transporter [Gammaproteobacteria bacterium]PKO47461.1 MAG: MFS transporter [Betaproteobacteria bacterium HGW-Betaproteobacteria-4]
MSSNNSTWRSPLVILTVGCVILTLSMGVRHTAGLFLQPMTADNGWTRETFSFAFALQNLIWGLGSPFAGALADRFGAGRTLLVAATFYVLGLVFMSVSPTPLSLDLSAGLLIGIGLSGTTFPVIMGVIGRHTTPERRSLALGIASAGGSFGQFAVLPIGQMMISTYGWQSALVLLACGVGLIAPLAYAMADGHKPSAGAGQSVVEALHEASRERSFHYLFWGYFVCGFQTAFIMLHLPSYLVDAGMSANVGMTAVALIGLFNIFGSFYFGWAGGRSSKKNLLVWIYGLRAVAIFIFMLIPLSTVTAWIFAAVIGILWLATVPLTNGLIAQIFGLRYMSMLTGVVFLGHQLGSFLGAWLGGRIFDQTGSYSLAWSISIGLSILAAICSWPVNEKPLARLGVAT